MCIEGFKIQIDREDFGSTLRVKSACCVEECNVTETDAE